MNGLSDAEMIALAALVVSSALSMKSEDDARIANGLAPAYGGVRSHYHDRLDAELVRRGLVAP